MSQKIEVLTCNIETKKEEYIKIVFRPIIKQKVKKLRDNKKAEYYKKVWEITLTNDIDKLMNGNKRGFQDYHIDHIIPIIYGYKNNIPAEEIGHINNLRPLYWKDNLLKAAKHVC